MTDLISRLRDTPNWMRESYGSWKDCVLKYDLSLIHISEPTRPY